jgi:hypothetical protein
MFCHLEQILSHELQFPPNQSRRRARYLCPHKQRTNKWDTRKNSVTRKRGTGIFFYTKLAHHSRRFRIKRRIYKKISVTSNLTRSAQQVNENEHRRDTPKSRRNSPSTNSRTYSTTPQPNQLRRNDTIHRWGPWWPSRRLRYARLHTVRIAGLSNRFHSTLHRNEYRRCFALPVPSGFQYEQNDKVLNIGGHKRTSLDTLNNRVQIMNTSESHTLLSTDKLRQVDDPHSVLKSIINDDVLNEYVVNGVPPHKLQLKRGDICLIMRNLSKRYGLAKNSRFIILSISQFCIRVQTVATPTKTAFIPRIRFRFKIPGGASYEVTRTQFPLRLAYCMTYNKAQEQTLESVLLGITSPPFAHGHLYVALSRVTHYANI